MIFFLFFSASEAHIAGDTYSPKFNVDIWEYLLW